MFELPARRSCICLPRHTAAPEVRTTEHGGAPDRWVER
jgi:hypothetical protein